MFQAPPLPTYYVDRPEYAQELKKRLLTNSSDPRTLVVTAIHGLGSIGKSTLATALAHDREVQEKYCDGILWATLGQKPNLLSLLSGWIQALGDHSFKATSVEAASNQLRTLLYDKAALLVVDDAWNTSDAQAFNVGGTRCQVTITTREGAIADALGASKYSLDVMKSSEAMELLTKKLGRKLTDAETKNAKKLAKSLGYLPLALELAAAQVAGGTSWTVLLRDMQQEVARLKSLDCKSARDVNDEASLKKLSLRASLNLSVQQLSDETRSNFIWLGVLPEDVSITPKMTATLWDMDDERDAADELGYLHSKSLLLSGVPLPDKTPTYRLHDLFHDLACNLLTAPQNPKRKGNLAGLGITLPQAHATFLENYRKLTSNNLWHTLPDDGYIHQRLVWHLEKAEKIEEIHKLFAEESENGGNGWYEACDRLGQTANFVTGLARAWELAEDDKQVKTNRSQVIGLQCRYALITASLNSLAANLPVELLIALLHKKVWTPEQALGNALQSSNPKQKAHLLTGLANHLPATLKKLALSEALAAAREIQSDYYRAYALSSLADKLPSELLPEALAAAREIQDDYYRAYALSSLAEKISQMQKPQLFDLWRENFHILSRRTRPNLLSDIEALTPVIFALGGAEAIKDTACAIQYVSRWWK
ncbi:NB-ARC domain-containing protein [Mastigocoleus testarum]|uniref:NB-ARC domain-containing protein n=1 Tax=Mastigocoleus testarum TaxID=996925 RepID=UPI002285CB39|nr:NB-ARC domain-containing protein [Mastigocoleus testarum]